MAKTQKRYPTRFQSVCRWSFHAGKGGFVPRNIRPELAEMPPAKFAEFVAKKIAPRVPENTRLGVAVHYDREVDEKSAKTLARALKDNGLALSMGSPGLHYYWGFGGIGSLDPKERKAAADYARRAVDVFLGPMRAAEDPRCPIVTDIWNGSFGYEIPTALVREMLKHADEAIGALLEHAQSLNPQARVGVEPKPNEGHPAMLYQTGGDVLALRGRLKRAGLDVTHFGLINEFGHTEMVGLDLAQEYAAASLENAIIHVHANSQGADGVRLGGSGKYDIDFELAASSTTLAVAQILLDTKYAGWLEHDIQPHPYDNAEQNIDRVVRAICNWEAICRTVEAGALSAKCMLELAVSRDMMAFEDIVRDAVAKAHELSKDLFDAGRVRR